MSFSGSDTLADSVLKAGGGEVPKLEEYKEEWREGGGDVSDKRRLTKNNCEQRRKVANSRDGQCWETMQVIWYKNHKYLH